MFLPIQGYADQWFGSRAAINHSIKMKPSIPENFVGPRIREFRRADGLSQKKLAAFCLERGLEMPRSTLAKVEAQIRFVKAYELFIIARILNRPLEQFFPPGFGDHKPAKLPAGGMKA